MGQITPSAVGRLCIDLSHVELSAREQQALLGSVHAAVVTQLRRADASAGPVAVSLSPGDGLAGGHLCLDLSEVELPGPAQQELLGAAQEAVVTQLAQLASGYKVVAISMSPNNGTKEARAGTEVPVALH